VKTILGMQTKYIRLFFGQGKINPTEWMKQKGNLFFASMDKPDTVMQFTLETWVISQ